MSTPRFALLRWLVTIACCLCLPIAGFAAEPTTLVGSEQDDLLTIDYGDYAVYGGAGTDGVAVPLFPNAYRFRQNGSDQYLADFQGFTSLFDSIEYFEFGRTYPTRLPVAELLTNRAQDQVMKLTDLYLAFFGRAPDVDGLEYWQNRLLEGGRDFATISKDFSWSGEAQTLYPQQGINNREFIRTVYRNCFGREPDPAGWNYWETELNRLDPQNPEYLNNRGAFVGQLLLGAYAATSGGEDRSLLMNRHEVALSYVNRLTRQPEVAFDPAINELLAMVTSFYVTRYNAENILDHIFTTGASLTEVMDQPDQVQSLWTHDVIYDTDNDGDGWSEVQGDCNDTLTTMFPGAPEICGDGFDQDCDGVDLPCEQGGGEEKWTLSTMSAYPGEFVTVFHSTLTAALACDIVFTFPGGGTMTASIADTSSGTARVAIPFYIDPLTGSNVEVQTRIRVNGHEVDGNFIIRAIPDLGLPAGTVYRYVLEKASESYTAALATLENDILIEVGWDPQAVNRLNLARTELLTRIAHCQTLISQIESGAVAVTFGDGQTVTLGSQELLQIDKWLTAWFRGARNALAEPLLAASATLPRTTNPDGSWTTPQQAIEEVLQALESGKDWNNVFLGGATLACTAAGLYVGGPVGAMIGGTAALAVTGLAALYELGSAAIIERLHEAYSTTVRPAYDYTREALEQLVRVALAAAGTASEEAWAMLITLISSGITVNDAIDAAEDARCGDQTERQRSLLPLSALGLIEEFCGDTGDPGDSSSVFFSDPSGDWTIKAHFPQGQTGVATVVTDQTAYNDQWVKIALDGYPSNPYAWDPVPVTLSATGGSIKQMRIYSASNNWDPASRNINYTVLTPDVTEYSMNASRYYWLYIYTEDPALNYSSTMQILRLAGEE